MQENRGGLPPAHFHGRHSGHPRGYWRSMLCARLAAFGLLLAVGCRSAATLESDVRRTLDSQVAAWNRGDIDGFMESYWKSDGLSFLSGATLTRGHATTLARYKKRYQPGAMGTLEFTEIEVHALPGGEAAYVLGRYTLSGTATQRGAFTLVLREIDGRWVVVHDHTGAEDPR